MSGAPATGGRRVAVRTRSAVAALVAAAVLGLVTGRFVLPAPPGDDAHPAGRSAPATTPASASASPTGTPDASGAPGAPGPVTTANLLDPLAFRPEVATSRIHVTDRYGDGDYANPACTGEKTLVQTLGGPGAHFRGLMTSPRTDPSDPTWAADLVDQVAREVAAEAPSPSLAEGFAERLLQEQVSCQQQPPGHWVYGRTTTVRFAPDVTASWMGLFEGLLNTTGRAPEVEEPCGGVAVLRSGSHYGVLDVHACLGTAAMDRVVRTALSRL
ncbi:hypothetical protein ACIPYS_23000 [Kitasatospora sp. NPDC089913]|uniref:hypothetical protein n=1 Tax=Kitasatospora sp. NPDC089913 TaxID=3364080 RepID=UPI00380D1235